jgi:hypothetical protein
MHVVKLLCITIPCHLANREAGHTAILMRKLLFADQPDPGTLTELQRFSHQVTLRHFKFTASRFLSLDLSLLVSMLGAVATHFVILIQFKIPENISPAYCKNVTG